MTPDRAIAGAGAEFAGQLTTEDGLAAASWTSVSRSPRVWGLAAEDFALAWWRSKGVAWVQRGSREEFESGADLFLLTEPTQVVVFSLEPLIHPLTWNRPSYSRLRIADSDGDQYHEQVELGRGEHVVAIRRAYFRSSSNSARVFLTSSPKLARIWSTAATRREAVLQLGSGGRRARSDVHRVAGSCYRLGDRAAEGSLISDLIGRWSFPDGVIDGIRQVAPGVWARDGFELRPQDLVVGPAWIGSIPEAADPLRLVGPSWHCDTDESIPVSLKALGEVEEVPPPAPGGDGSQGSPDSIKRVIDVLVSAVALIVLLPVLLLIAGAIVLDDGFPVVFGHERQTRGGRVFRCLKFRTMRRGAERLAEQLREQNVCDGPQVFIENDPRVTRVGRLLRRFHLDELLQLLNVLVGDMSLVGPRPSPERENRLCPAWREGRLSVRPGITGLWQVCRTRQAGLDFQEWIRFDLEYVERCNLRLDAWIIWKTLLGLVKREHEHGGSESIAS